MVRIAVVAVAAVLVSGCAATPPVSGNETGGLVDLSLSYPNDKIFAAADAHCAKYGKVARVTRSNSAIDDNATFECVSKAAG